MTLSFNIRTGMLRHAKDLPKVLVSIVMAILGSTLGFAHLKEMNFIYRSPILADMSWGLGSLDIVFGEVDR